jgi:hypothetical protein
MHALDAYFHTVWGGQECEDPVIGLLRAAVPSMTYTWSITSRRSCSSATHRWSIKVIFVQDKTLLIESSCRATWWLVSEMQRRQTIYSVHVVLKLQRIDAGTIAAETQRARTATSACRVCSQILLPPHSLQRGLFFPAHSRCCGLSLLGRRLTAGAFLS